MCAVSEFRHLAEQGAVGTDGSTVSLAYLPEVLSGPKKSFVRQEDLRPFGDLLAVELAPDRAS